MSSSSSNDAAVSDQIVARPVPAPSVILASSVVASNQVPWTTRDISRKYRLDNSGRLRTPLCQREYAAQWKKSSQRGELIDSIFHNFPLGTIILEKTYPNGDDIDYHDIYDGRHRIETIARFVNNEFKYKGLLYRELCASDKKVFDERKIPVIEIEFAADTEAPVRSTILAEIFVRLNKGVKLTSSDLCWASRDTPLIRETLAMLDAREADLRTVFGGFDIKNRKNLDNWVALCLGLSTSNGANFTTSYIRISDQMQNEPNVAAINSGIDTLIRLYSAANDESPVAAKDLKKYAKTGFVNAFFFADLFKLENATRGEAVFNRWLDIIRRLRDASTASRMMLTLKTTGAQNLNAIKVSKVLRQVDAYFAGDEVDYEDEEDDEESI